MKYLAGLLAYIGILMLVFSFFIQGCAPKTLGNWTEDEQIAWEYQLDQAEGDQE